MQLIDTTEELNKACKILAKQKVIAIDCEFIREKTYYPIPCLIQVGYEGGAMLIDPQAENLDFTAFFVLLQNKNIIKVFHAGRQDIEILYNLSGEIPEPVYDTQIAAQACGLGESVSYENLVRTYCGVELDKSCRLTNWQIRPLTDEQLEYAAGDVTYLITCYKKIKTFLKENKRESWIADDMQELVNREHYDVKPDNAWQRIRHNSHAVSFLNALKALAAWRENRAKNQNVSRQNIIKDDLLINISVAFPKNMEEMKQVRGMRPDVARSVLAEEMLAVLNSLNEKSFDRTLSKVDKEKDVSLAAGLQSLYEILKLLLKIQCNEHGVVAHLVTTEKNLREYILNPKAPNPILKGWRYEIFGKAAEEFRQGKLALTYNPTTHDIEIKKL